MLKIDWSYPVWKPEERAYDPDERTVSRQIEHALPVEVAYKWVSGEDRRPLLVLRECELCKGTDHALLSRTLDNEQTVLLTKWFHCVKMPPNVLGKEHPFTNMWSVKEGDKVPHIFFADPDGDNKLGLPGDQSQTELWKTMFSYLDRCYEGNAKRAVKEMRKLLTQFDTLDSQERDLKGRMDREIERNGAKSKKLDKLNKELEELIEGRSKLLAREEKIREMALKGQYVEELVGSDN